MCFVDDEITLLLKHVKAVTVAKREGQMCVINIRLNKNKTQLALSSAVEHLNFNN